MPTDSPTLALLDPPPDLSEEHEHPAVHPDLAATLQPYICVAAEDPDREDYRDGLRTLVARFLAPELKPAPMVTALIGETGLDTLGGSGSVREALPEAVREAMRQVWPGNNTVLRDEITKSLAPALWRHLSRKYQDPPPIEAVVERLELVADYIAIYPTETGRLLRLDAEQRLRKRFGRDVAAELLRRYVDPAPVLRPAYDENGILRGLDFSEERPVSWLVEDLIPAAAVGGHIGDYSSGKTFASLALALSVAFGTPWMGSETGQGGHALYLASEGVARIEQRIAGWLVAHDLLPESFTRADLVKSLNGRLTVATGPRLDDPKFQEVLVQNIRENDSRLVVVDTLSRFLGSTQSENENDTANDVMSAFARIAAETGATILYLHHPGHQYKTRPRGASAWGDAADFLYISEGRVKDGASVPVTCIKQRDSERFAKTAYRLRSLHVTCDGQVWDTAVMEQAKLPDDSDIPLDLRIRALLLHSPGMTKTDVKKAVHGRAADVAAMIQTLIKDNKIEDRGDGRGSSLYVDEEAWPSPTFEADDSLNLDDLTGGAND